MSKNKIRLLVVGGNGFIGHHIINHALGIGWDVTSLNLSPQHKNKSISAAHYLSADITDSAKLKDTLDGSIFEYVVNCGGYIDHSLFFRGGRKILDAHFMGVLNLVEILDRNILKAFVNIGSSDEYGNCPAPQVEFLRESPISPYSLSKVAASHFLQMLYRTESFPATTLRLFLTYGPGQDQKRFLPQVITGCINNTSFPVSAGNQLRDFCYISDTVDAVFSVFDNAEAQGEIINIASGMPVSIKQVLNNIQTLVGAGSPRFGEIAYREGENMALYANTEKAKKILGWQPRVALEDGLINTINWYRNNL